MLTLSLMRTCLIAVSIPLLLSACKTLLTLIAVTLGCDVGFSKYEEHHSSKYSSNLNFLSWLV